MTIHKLAYQLKIALLLSVSSSMVLFAADKKLDEESEHKRDTEVSATLGSVVVTAKGYAQDVKDAPASVTVIGNNEIAEKPFYDIGDALKNVEGVHVSKDGESGGENIAIRGMPAEYTLLMIDGQRVSRTSSFSRPNGSSSTSGSFIPPSAAIDRIEVVRGPMSTLYGSDALGGVVNIITKKVPEKWGGNISFSLEEPLSNKFSGNNNTAVYVGGPIKPGLLGVALTGNFQTQRDAKGTYATSKREEISGDYTGKLANFSGLGEHKNFKYGARLTFTPENQIYRLSYDRGVQRFENNKGQLMPAGKKGFSDQLRYERNRLSLTQELQLGFATVETGILWDEMKTIGMLNWGRGGVVSPRNIKNRDLILDHKWMFGLDNHFITAGLQYKNQHVKDSQLGAPIDFKQWQWALFAEDEWMITDKLTATIGARYDKNEGFGSHLSPRIYLTWNLDDHWQVKGGVSRAFKSPAPEKMKDGVIGLGRMGQMAFIGNPDLDPETSTSAEIGVSYTNRDNFSMNVTGFYSEFKDKIEPMWVENCRLSSASICARPPAGWENDPYFRQEHNVDDAKLYGLEVGVQYKPLENVDMSANYTYTHSRYDYEGNQKTPFGRTPQHMLNAKANWQLNGQWRFWTEAEYRAKEYRGTDMRTGGKLYYRSYALVNLGASFKPSREATINFGIDNIFDRNFVDFGPAEVRRGMGMGYQNRYSHIDEGRKVWLKLNYDF